MTYSAKKDIGKSLEEFGNRGQPLLRVALVAAFLEAALLWSVHLGVWFSEGLNRADPAKLLFASYFVVMAAMWVVYFVASFDLPLFRIRTLRHLLSATSEIYGSRILGDEEGAEGSLAEAFRDKARTSITMLAMLSAGAALIMTRALSEVPIAKADSWESVMATGAAGAAIAALVCFVVSVDSFDVLYNLFGNKESVERVHMLQFFYNNTRNTRYYGVMFLLWAVGLFAARYHPLLGAFAVSLVVSVGWAHWFPMPPTIGHLQTSSRAGFLARALFVGIPVAWLLAACAGEGFFLTDQ